MARNSIIGWLVSGVFALVAATLLAGCGKPPPPPWETGELVVLTRNSPTTYFFDAEGRTAGFEHDLARRFAESQGWRVRFETENSLPALLKRLSGGEAHLAAAGLAITPRRLSWIGFGPVYAKENELVVCGPTVRRATRPADLVGLRVEVVAGSTHVEQMKALRGKVRGLAWQEVETPSEDDLLERVSTGLADCAVADATSYHVARNFLPGLQVAFTFPGERQIAWALPKRTDRRFKQALEKFFAEMARSGEMKQLRERYFGHVRRLDEADVVGILARRGSVLPRLKPFFYRAQLASGLDWRLLAAVAYQESQWDARAVSPTGVRGIMMLTEDTADRLGVKDRLDPQESILGGARYLRMLRESLPEDIPEPDRTWMALAGYNIGPAHLADARRLAERLGRDADAWNQLKEVLPLLAKAQYADRLKYGFARGGESRAFAENVRIYFDILARYERPYIDEI